jgi:hypothetical protein
MTDYHDSLDTICASCASTFGDEGQGCGLFHDCLTPDEEASLAMLRQLKTQINEHKAQIKTLESTYRFSLEEKQELELNAQEQDQTHLLPFYQEWKERRRQLEDLQQQWRFWRAKQQEANKIKMKLLGYPID